MSDMITRSIIVKATADRAFAAWSNFENFPHFMKYVQEVRRSGDGMSHWVIQGPLGKDVEWTAETTLFEANKRIGWSTKDHKGDVTTSGQVTFNPLSQGETEVTVMMQYIPKLGVVGDVVAAIFAKPEHQVEEDLKNFKAYVEGMHDRTNSG